MSRPAILLDRDGTIIVDRHYLSDPAGVVLEPGAGAGLRRLQDAGYVLAVLTNQSGVARGYFDCAAVDAVNARTGELLAEQGVGIAGWFVCPHGTDDGCACRKPAPGLAYAAAEALDLDLARSVVIGDKASDVAVADAVGATGLLVLTGNGVDNAADVPADRICRDLSAAANSILRETADMTGKP